MNNWNVLIYEENIIGEWFNVKEYMLEQVEIASRTDNEEWAEALQGYTNDLIDYVERINEDIENYSLVQVSEHVMGGFIIKIIEIKEEN